MAVLNLDTVVSSALYFSGKWTPALRRNQSRDVLRSVLNRLYGAGRGSLFHARVRCSQAALAASCGISRVWVNQLIARLREAGWIQTSAARLPDGKQEVTVFRAGRMLKRLLVMLLRSRQRRQSRVNDCQQKIPTQEQIQKGKQFLQDLQGLLTRKLGVT